MVFQLRIKLSSKSYWLITYFSNSSPFNLFFENSTRTRTTFEIAANRLSADIINLDNYGSSSDEINLYNDGSSSDEINLDNDGYSSDI